MKKTRKARRSSADTLCWFCENAVPSKDGKRGCPWSKYFLPVDGWTAIETEIDINHGERTEQKRTKSYHVLKCPLCVPDEESQEHSKKAKFMGIYKRKKKCRKVSPKCHQTAVE